MKEIRFSHQNKFQNNTNPLLHFLNSKMGKQRSQQFLKISLCSCIPSLRNHTLLYLPLQLSPQPQPLPYAHPSSCLPRPRSNLLSFLLFPLDSTLFLGKMWKGQEHSPIFLFFFFFLRGRCYKISALQKADDISFKKTLYHSVSFTAATLYNSEIQVWDFNAS